MKSYADIRRVNGVPSHRFIMEIVDEEGRIQDMQSFSGKWELGDKFWRAEKNGETVHAYIWNKDSDEFELADDEARAEGEKRAERYKASNGKKEKTGPAVPPLSSATVNSMKEFSSYVKLLAQSGAKEGLDETTKASAAHAAIDFILELGYSEQDLRKLFQNYVNAAREKEAANANG